MKSLTKKSITLISGIVLSLSYFGCGADDQNPATQVPQTNRSYTKALTNDINDRTGTATEGQADGNVSAEAIAAKGPSPVELGTAGGFAILAKAGITTTGPTSIAGNIGISPAAHTNMTGFSETLDASNIFATSPLVTGKIFGADLALPTPPNLTKNVADMETAYTNAAGRVNADFIELGIGNISGKTLVPGLYKWSSGVLINSDITLEGGPNDVWIFQIAQTVTVASGVHVTLSGGALPKNIFWAVAEQVVLGTSSAFKGNILGKTQIVIQTGASLNGRALAQTAVTLDSVKVTKPTP